MISRLPKIEIPKEETLVNEDKCILDAFKILLNGYQRSQSRLRRISKAYAELESLFLRLLEDRRENDEKSAEKKTTPSSEKTDRKKSSIKSNDDSREDVLMVDLTDDFEALERSVDDIVGATSPIFGQRNKSSRKNRDSENEIASKTSSKLKIERTELVTPNKAKRSLNDSANSADDGNEENRPPLLNDDFQSFKIVETDSPRNPNDSKPTAKIGMTKTIYSIDPRKNSAGKRSKQSTLVLQPLPGKIDLGLPENPPLKPKTSRKWGDLFTENYRHDSAVVDKICREKDLKLDKIVTDDTNNERSAEFRTPSKNVTTPCRTIFKSAKNEKSKKIGNENDEKLLIVETASQIDAPVKFRTPSKDVTPCRTIFKSAKKEKSKKIGNENDEKLLIVETASQIDATARSLFEDDDIDDFDESKDILNTCMDSTIIVNGVEAVPSTSKPAELTVAMDSLDETFFAPGEISQSAKNPKNVINDVATEKSRCVAVVEEKESRNQSRCAKRKSDDDGKFDGAKETTDFGLQDVDWDDVDISNDWTSPKKSVDDSFDTIPEKKKKTPMHAHQEKAVRNKLERAKLRGWNCKECEKYYGNMNLSDDELKKHMDRCSRHRSKYNQRYLTPKDFWNPVFPDTVDSSDFSGDESLDNRK